MSALVVEDGSVVAGANTYRSLADLIAYFQRVGEPAAWAAASDEDQRQAAVVATLFLDDEWGQRLMGSLVNNDQELAFPRWGLEDDTGKVWGGDEVPSRWADAQSELAAEHLDTPLNLNAASRGKYLKSLRIEGVIKLDYDDDAPTDRRFPFVDHLVSRFMSYGSSQQVLERF